MINSADLIINPSNWRVDTIHIGNSKTRILKIKNFFDNPDKVRDICLSSNFVSTVMGEYSALSGYMVRIGNVTTNFFKPFTEALQKYMDASPYILQVPNRSIFTFQKYEPGSLCRTMSLYPHIDRLYYACVLSLNTSTELEHTESGTAFCRHVETNMEYACSDINYRHSRVQNYNQEMVVLDPSSFERSGWEIYHIESHEYNSLLMYEGNVWHTPYFNSNWNCDRITFNGFMK